MSTPHVQHCVGDRTKLEWGVLVKSETICQKEDLPPSDILLEI